MRRLFFYSQSSSRIGPLIIKRSEMDLVVRLEVISFIFYSCLALPLKNTLILLIFTPPPLRQPVLGREVTPKLKMTEINGKAT